jgi:hypothetical protein
LVYGLQVKQAYPGFAAPRVRVGTFVDAPVTFFVILYLTRRWGWKVALASAVIGTAAAPIRGHPAQSRRADEVLSLRAVCAARRGGAGKSSSTTWGDSSREESRMVTGHVYGGQRVTIS